MAEDCRFTVAFSRKKKLSNSSEFISLLFSILLKKVEKMYINFLINKEANLLFI